MVENLEKTKDRNASDPIAISCGECADEHRQLAEWLKELKKLMEQTSWIPVEERLPGNDDCVLVYDNVDFFVAWYNWYGWHSTDNNFDEYTPIIAWMPLPQPYQPKEGRE
jgi:hypothetical protein